jgi:hypothetical protein
MKNYTKILKILLFTSVISYALTCFTYWMMNPYLSQIQVFLKFWYWFAINIGLGIWFAKVDLR